MTLAVLLGEGNDFALLVIDVVHVAGELVLEAGKGDLVVGERLAVRRVQVRHLADVVLLGAVVVVEPHEIDLDGGGQADEAEEVEDVEHGYGGVAYGC